MRVISVNGPKAQRAYWSGHIFNKIRVLETTTVSSHFSQWHEGPPPHPSPYLTSDCSSLDLTTTSPPSSLDPICLLPLLIAHTDDALDAFPQRTLAM